MASVNYHPGRFLILIVDDGSTESIQKETIIIGLKKDLPIHILRINQNAGITFALNTGLEWIEKNCPVKYIARLDCGDICDPERFYLQVDYMNSHTETGLVGSWCIFEERTKNSRYSYKTPLTHHALVRAMHFRNVFIHPTVIFRKSLITKVGLYPVNYPYAEDYAFFWELIKVKQSFVLNKFLVVSEINREGISFKNWRKQIKARQQVVSAFATKPFLKILGIIRLKLLYILPKRLILFLKQLTR